MKKYLDHPLRPGKDNTAGKLTKKCIIIMTRCKYMAQLYYVHTVKPVKHFLHLLSWGTDRKHEWNNRFWSETTQRGGTHLCWCLAACSFQYSSSSSRDPNSGGSGSPISSPAQVESWLSCHTPTLLCGSIKTRHLDKLQLVELRLEIVQFIFNVTPVSEKSKVIMGHSFRW